MLKAYQRMREAACFFQCLYVSGKKNPISIAQFQEVKQQKSREKTFCGSLHHAQALIVMPPVRSPFIPNKYREFQHSGLNRNMVIASCRVFL
jgi:hypothetical protein